MSFNKQFFHTRLPDTPLTFSTPFTRSRPSTSGKPLAKDDPDYTYRRNAERGACGIDGLKAGQDDILTLARDPKIAWDSIRWWEHGTREQVLHAEGDGGSELDGRRVKSGCGPHDAIKVDSTSVEIIIFHCQE